MWVEIVICLLALPVGMYLDSSLYEGVRQIMQPLLGGRRYRWRDFRGYRLLGTAAASLGIAYSGVAKDLTVGMASSALFIGCNAVIYLQIYARERRGSRDQRRT